MSRYLESLYGSDDEDDDYSGSEEEAMTLEEQRKLFYGNDEDDQEEGQDDDVEEDTIDQLQQQFRSTSALRSKTKIEVPKQKKQEPEKVIVYVEQKGKEERNWDQTYESLSKRKIRLKRFQMRDLEAHKLHYDKIDYPTSFEKTAEEGESSDSENEDDEDHDGETSSKKSKKKSTKVFQQKLVKQSIDLSLSKMAGCIAGGNLIVLSGGSKDGKLYSQLVAYDTKNERWIDLKERMFEQQTLLKDSGLNTQFLFPPPMSCHALTVLGEALIWYDCRRTALALRFFMDLTKQKWRPRKVDDTEMMPKWLKIDINDDGIIKETQNHGSCLKENGFWIFGGRDVNSNMVMNQLIRCEFEKERYNYYNRQNYSDDRVGYHMTRTLITTKNGAPLPRENHAQCVVDHNLYIFGGNYTSKDRLLNDLHVYNPTTNKWSEIDMTYIPPPMREHSFSAVDNKYVYLVGGILENNVVSDVLYRLEPKTKNFFVVNPGGPSTHVLLGNGSVTPKDLQQPRASHLAVSDASHVYIFGGLSDVSKRTFCNYGVVLKEILDVGVENSSYHYLMNEFTKQRNGELTGYDVILRVADRTSGESEYVYGHKCLLSSRSTYFKELFKNSTGEIVDEKELFEIKDYHLDSLSIYVRFLYCGDIVIPEDLSNQLETLQDLLTISKPDCERQGIITDICSEKRLFLDSSTSVLNQLKSDFGNLYTQIEQTMDNFIPEPCHENHYADVTIQILDPNTDEVIHQLRAHKLFLCKSNYIQTVFQSNMEESATGIIKFSEISLNGLLCVLRYLYTNDILIPLENSVEVFIASLLFQLNELANYARTIVCQHITMENVIDITFLVDVYNDLALKNNCIRCLVQHYETLSKHDVFETLPVEIKGEVKTRYFEQVKKLTKMKAKERMKNANKHKQ
ncbi:hypothetical protein C9374_011273 [Naegleria lovaniensis]|uniref:BTB domain-containing protein n=1 Tax=Naegleria lovaniensis TaxID=51637 RepID=A0AA88H0J3_NAELO|nr:uncharacterized protein C9374_011273 [Naegleria lovaniensis]KAG2392548.1 hypothetical protein C9374_011273 [Naegleria lovaniensis]